MLLCAEERGKGEIRRCSQILLPWTLLGLLQGIYLHIFSTDSETEMISKMDEGKGDKSSTEGSWYIDSGVVTIARIEHTIRPVVRSYCAKESLECTATGS